MAQYEHLPIYKKAFDMTVYIEKYCTGLFQVSQIYPWDRPEKAFCRDCAPYRQGKLRAGQGDIYQLAQEHCRGIQGDGQNRQRGEGVQKFHYLHVSYGGDNFPQ